MAVACCLLLVRVFRQLLKFVARDRLPGVLLRHRPQGLEKGVVADHPAEHVKDHGALVEHDGLVLGRELVQVARLADRRGVLVGEGADDDVVHGVFEGVGSRRLLDVESG